MTFPAQLKSWWVSHIFVSGKHYLLGLYISCDINVNPSLLMIINHADFENNNR